MSHLLAVYDHLGVIYGHLYVTCGHLLACWINLRYALFRRYIDQEGIPAILWVCKGRIVNQSGQSYCSPTVLYLLATSIYHGQCGQSSDQSRGHK